MIEKREADNVISATDAKNRFGRLISQVAESGEAVVVERQGRPRAAIISIAEYRQLREWQREQRRQEAIEALRQLRAEISERNRDMTEADIEQIAQEIRHEVAQGLLDKGLVRYAD